ncbi:MAG: GspE/PulE family protein, partial [Burkholderiaceae bacterium]
LARIKIMCDLDISEGRKPQDGKIKFRKFGPLYIQLRVAAIPSAGGVEDVVMRILAAGEPIPLDKLGVLPHNLERLKEVISKPYGIFFVCGPTGSGKTTTLHSVLSYLNTPDTKIWTAEDPVEITQKGLRQVQVNRKAGLDFATVMRAFLRADPDVIMVGEMRDKETVSIGLEASLTGHLVFATLHTNSAPESIVRLLDMGMDPFNFADALLGVLAQRLARRLCGNCKLAYQPSEQEIQELVKDYCSELLNTERFSKDAESAQQTVLEEWTQRYADSQGRFTLYRAIGCDQCTKGYKGRVGLHELMIGTDKIKRLLQEHARVAQLLAAALDDGMLTLKMDGIEKVLSGLTDIKQVRLVCIK